MTEPRLTAQEQDLFTRFVYELTGIVVETEADLVEGRLGGLLGTLGCGTYSELFYKVRNDTSGSLKNAVIDRVTTQETSFFRDQAPFETFKLNILPDLVDARRRQHPGQPRVPLRIWSAACATGQEAYSVAIALMDVLGDLSGYTLEILGTDISEAAVAKASAGTYTALEIERGLPAGLRDRHFRSEGGQYRAADELRALVTFRKLNLHEDFSALGRWDAIFCRNVAVYFSEADKKNLFFRLHAALEPGGALVIGAAESLLGLCPEFVAKRYGRSVFYSKV